MFLRENVHRERVGAKSSLPRAREFSEKDVQNDVQKAVISQNLINAWNI